MSKTNLNFKINFELFISDSILDEYIVNNDNLQSKSLQLSSLSLEKSHNEDSMSSYKNNDLAPGAENLSNILNPKEGEKFTATLRSTHSSGSEKNKTSNDQDNFKNSNFNHNSIAVMTNIDEQKAKNASLSKKSSKSRKPWYSVSNC